MGVAWPAYKFRDETEARRVFGFLVDNIYAGRAAVTSTVLYGVDTNERREVLIRTQNAEPLCRREDAMRSAWRWLLNESIRPPDWALGQTLGQVEKQALLYVLTHGPWPSAVSAGVTELLKALGVDAPDSIPGIFTGAAKEVLKTMTRKKVIDALIDSLTELKASYDEAETDNVLTQAELQALGIKFVGLVIPKLFS
jgi:hypothetical protein